MKPSLLTLSMIGLIGLMLSGCNNKSSHNPVEPIPTTDAMNTLKEVRIGHQKSGSLVFLKDAKFLDEALAKRGIQVRWVEFPSGPPLLEAMNTGNIEFGTTGESPPIFAQVANANLRYVGINASSPESEAIIVPKGSTIAAIADLKGKKIGVTRGSSAHLTLVRALEANGIGFDEITPLYLSPSDARAAFERGNLDAWVIWEPFLSSAEQDLAAVSIANTSGLKEISTYYLASTELAERNPEILMTIIEQLQVGDEAIRTDLPNFARITAQQTGLSEAITSVAVARRNYQFSYVTPAAILEQQRAADAFFRLNLIPRSIQVSDIVWLPPESH